MMKSSYIEKLLKGAKVEWKRLGEIVKIKNGKDWKRLNVGNIPVYGSGGVMAYVDKFTYDKPTVLIPRKGSITNIFYVETPIWNVDTIYYTEIDINKLIPKFFYYYMKTVDLMKLDTGSGRPSLTKAILNEIQIPIPPLPVQQEIVRILDAFTKLTAELTAELTARKKQYEYYRDKLLTPIEDNGKWFLNGKEVEWKKLGDLCTIGDGLHGTPKYNDNGEYYFINGNNLDNGRIVFNDKTKKVDDITFNKYGIDFTIENTVFMSINGTIGNVSFYNNEKIVLGKSVAFFNIISSELHLRYLYYFLQTNYSNYYFESQKTGSTIKNLGLKALRAFKIPIPPLEEQERIVSILDKFDTLTNSITEGLPREIELRQKQYEYYRDLLLSFPKEED